MSKKDSSKPEIKSTKSYLKVSEIKSDTLIMDNGNLSAVIAVSSTNFALKSQEEQDALIFGYQNFINSLDFDIQILMQSRKMDIHTYLENLKKVMEQQTNELLRVQTAEYIEFVSKLVENASIMNKNFYVIVPYRTGSSSNVAPKKGGLFSLFQKSDLKGELESKLKNFQEHKLKLDQRVNTVVSGLASVGLKSIQLRTEEIIELLYNSYNIDSGPLIDTSKLSELKMRPLN
jgi:hypothetical protein